MKTIAIIGVGNIGSRHLQALKAVRIPLKIFIIDPSKVALDIARERYGSMPVGKYDHTISFSDKMPSAKKIDLAIIATCADVRAEMIRALLKNNKVRFIVLEKLLFTKKTDYKSIGNLLGKNKIKAWVNCPMRTMYPYNFLQTEFNNRKIEYNASWSGYGLMTSAIHYIDHMVYLIGSDDFTINTDGLDKNPIPSKRKGFLEFTGTLRILFKNNSVGNLTCYNNNSDNPILVQFFSDKAKCIVKETDEKMLVSQAKNGWEWNESEAKIPFQSQLTTLLVEDILNKGKCGLVDYRQSSKIHLQLLESVFKFLNKNSKKKYKEYLFT